MESRRWAVPLLVALAAAALVATAVFLGASGDDCEQWQEEYRAAEGFGEGAAGTLDFINMGPMAELEAARPEGCEIPE